MQNPLYQSQEDPQRLMTSEEVSGWCQTPREARNKTWLARLAKAFTFEREPQINWSPTEKYKPRQKRVIRIVSAKDRVKSVQSST